MGMVLERYCDKRKRKNLDIDSICEWLENARDNEKYWSDRDTFEYSIMVDDLKKEPDEKVREKLYKNIAPVLYDLRLCHMIELNILYNYIKNPNWQ